MSRLITIPTTDGVGPDYAAARAALVQQLQQITTDFPDLDIEYADPVDTDTVSSPFVFVDVRWDHSKSTGVGVNANQRVYGSFILNIFNLQGSTGLSSNNLLKYLTMRFRNKTLAPVVTTNPMPGKSDSRHGWDSQELVVPFWFDSIG